jgi:hypothetical protein
MLYLAVMDAGRTASAIYRYDPSRRTLVDVARSRSLQRRHQLDDVLPYRVSSMLNDTARDCIWMIVSGQDRTGIWQYRPRDPNPFRRVSEQWGRRFGWHGSKLAIHLATDCVDLLDVESGRCTRLLGGKSAMFGHRHAKAVVWPCLVFGDHIVSAENRITTMGGVSNGKRFTKQLVPGLYLHTANPRRSILRSDLGEDADRIRYAIQISATEALIGADTGKFWKLTGKTAIAPEDTK